VRFVQYEECVAVAAVEPIAQRRGVFLVAQQVMGDHEP
jgi:hypothetical protein